MCPGPVLSIATDESALRSRVATEHLSKARRSASPDTPPYSPLTPVLASRDLPEINGVQQLQQQQQNASLAHHKGSRAELEPQQYRPNQTQPLLPISESDNPDAIALRSALSILHIQRQKVLRDMKNLERQKQVAMANPQAFAADVVAGRVKTAPSDGLGVAPRLDHPAAAAEEEEEEAEEAEAEAGEALTDDDNREQPSSNARRSKFDDVPGPQDIVRAPPINWAKYHIVGEPLERMHEEQRARPTPGQPRRGAGDESRAGPGPGPSPKHVIAAPYNPWTDKLSDSPARNRGLPKKEKG